MIRQYSPSKIVMKQSLKKEKRKHKHFVINIMFSFLYIAVFSFLFNIGITPNSLSSFISFNNDEVYKNLKENAMETNLNYDAGKINLSTNTIRVTGKIERPKKNDFNYLSSTKFLNTDDKNTGQIVTLSKTSNITGNINPKDSLISISNATSDDKNSALYKNPSNIYCPLKQDDLTASYLIGQTVTVDCQSYYITFESNDFTDIQGMNPLFT